ncbi:MAG: Putative Polyferredoxin [Clostridiales bacterium 38_11]|nr:MAG: Putative Polyferredoxin [Clostridiales bacterium 38_11]HBH11936.1 polyferredoxin [Clostridiales bacterium]
MKPGIRSRIQIIATVIVILSIFIYFLYISDIVDFKIFSIGDLNPYGGWSALKSIFTDVSYRWGGISRSIALSISITLTALLLGRVFCGFLCPIGALQDGFRFLAGKLRIKKKRLPSIGLAKPESIKYVLLIILIVLSTFGLSSRISVLSPWLAYLNAFAGLRFHTGLFVLILIVLSSVFFRRFFCRCFCPLGAFQALLNAISPLKISKGKSCNGCQLCLKDCPVDIMPDDEDAISPECVNCLKCTEVSCVKDSPGYQLTFAGKAVKNKTYLRSSLLLFLVLFIMLPLSGNYKSAQGAMDLGELKDGVYQGLGVGFGGNITISTTVIDNRISNIEITSHRETQGYYEEVFKTMTKEIIETQNLNVDAISGATVTSRGFLGGVKSGVGMAMEDDTN